MRERLILLTFVIAVISIVVGLVPSQEIQLLYRLELRGRLVSAETGEPVRQAWVLTLPPHLRKEWWAEINTRREQWVDGYYLRDKDGARVGIGTAHSPWGEALTDDDGKFRITVGVPWTWRAGLSLSPSTEKPPDRYGVGALSVEATDGASAIAGVEGGEWTDTTPDGWASWDLGDVGVDLSK